MSAYVRYNFDHNVTLKCNLCNLMMCMFFACQLYVNYKYNFQISFIVVNFLKSKQSL